MIKQINKTILVSILSAVIYIIFGVIMIINPDTAIELVAVSLGSIMGIVGTISIIRFLIDKNKYNFTGFGFAGGVISVVLALLILFKYKELLTLIPLILGIVIIINGALKTEFVMTLKREPDSNWWIMFGLTMVEIVLGVILVFNPFPTAIAITQIVGLFIVTYSIVDIIECVMLKAEINRIKKEMQAK